MNRLETGFVPRAMIHGSGGRGADQKNKCTGDENRFIRVVFSSAVTVPVELSADYYSMFTVTPREFQ